MGRINSSEKRRVRWLIADLRERMKKCRAPIRATKKNWRRPRPPLFENPCGASRVSLRAAVNPGSVAIDATAIALVAVARQAVEIVVDLDGRNESGRGHGDRVSLHLLRVMKSVVVLSRRVRRERRKSEAQRKRHGREFHFVLH